MFVTLKFVKLSANATIPTKGLGQAVGYDLFSAYDYIVPSRDSVIIKTDIQITFPKGFPKGCYEFISSSPATLNKWVSVESGISTNCGYCVILLNLTNEDIEIKKGDCIAQWSCINYSISRQNFISEEEACVYEESKHFCEQLEKAYNQARRKRANKHK